MIMMMDIILLLLMLLVVVVLPSLLVLLLTVIDCYYLCINKESQVAFPSSGLQIQGFEAFGFRTVGV